MSTLQAAPAATSGTSRVESPARLAPLDLLRGFAVAAMVLVNNPGDYRAVYRQLAHAGWFGWTFADTIAPLFLWVVGFSLLLTVQRQRANNYSRSRMAGTILFRASVLTAIGLVLTAIPRPLPLFSWTALEHFRVLGVLQRIAVCYAATGFLIVYGSETARRVSTLASLVIYWLLMVYVSVPGFGPGILQPDGNLSQYLDRMLLGQHANRYEAWGVLSTVPAIGTTLLGVEAACWFSNSKARHRLSVAAASSLGLFLAGLVTSAYFPLSKNLWSPPYVLLNGGLSLAGFALFIAWHTSRFLPFVRRVLASLGRQALPVFVVTIALANLLEKTGIPALGKPWISFKGILFAYLFRPWGSPELMSAAYAMVWVIGSIMLANWLTRRNISFRF